jgi:excisionase family DNA binding protein
MGKQLTIGQTAKRLGLEVDTVRKLERAGKIRAVRTRGGHRRFTEEEIDRFRKGRRNVGAAKTKRRRSHRTPRRPTTQNRQAGHG